MKKMAVVILFALLCITCKTDIGSSGSFIIIEYINPSLVQSDVLTSGSIYDDRLEIYITANMRNPLEIPTLMSSIIVDQIDVEYTRNNSSNIPGKDIPFGYSLPWNQSCVITSGTGALAVGGTLLENVVVIRHIAKIEPPLIDLRETGQEKILYLNGKITIHAYDLGGHRLEPVSANITIQCADFAD